jgi:HK97 family phage major capsid protein
MDPKDLNDKRQKLGELVTAQRAILDKATAEKRELTGDEDTTYLKMDKDVEALDGEINATLASEKKAEERAQKLAEREEHLAQRQREPIRPDTTAPGSKDEKRDLVPSAFRRRWDPGVRAAFEARGKPEYESAFREYLVGNPSPDELRALSVGTASQGGYAVPTQEFITKLIQKMDDEAPLLAAATKYDVPNAQSLGAPSLESNPDDADWTTELATGSEDSAMAFGKRELAPWPLAKLLKVSKKLLRASPLNIEGIVRDRLAYKVAIPVSKALNSGTGANQPLGIFVADAAGIPAARDTTLLTSSAIDPDKLITMRHSIRDAYKNLTWVMHRTTLAAIRKLKGSATGNYMWQPGMGMMNVPSTLLDFPYILEENAPVYATSGGTYLCLLGDLSYIWVARALTFEVQRLDELYAATNQVGFIVRAEIDAMPVLGDAFVRGTAT